MESKIKWEKGDTAVVRKGWDCAGKEFEVLGEAIYREQWWVPVSSDEHDDPDWYKESGLFKKMTDEQKKDTLLKALKTLEFVKEVFCIDGSITLMPITKYSFNGTCMKLTDSKRGTFYIAMIQEDELQVE